MFVQAHYDLADNLTFNTMAIYNNRVSQQQLAPEPAVPGRRWRQLLQRPAHLGVRVEPL